MRLIDANKLVMHLADFALSMSGKPGYSEIQQCMEAVEEQPTVDPVKHGRWIEQEPGDWRFSKEFRCSECGMYRLVTNPAGWEWNFCPYCGAKMNEVE